MIKSGGLILSSCGLIVPLFVFGIVEFARYNNIVVFAIAIMALVGLAILIGIATDPE